MLTSSRTRLGETTSSYRRRGFHLLDLCILLAVGVLLLLGVIPLLRQMATEQSNRIKCASNLRRIGVSGLIYANQDRQMRFPRTYFNPSADLDKSLRGGIDDHPSQRCFDAVKPADPVGENNVPASLYLALKNTDLTTDVFVCPSSEGTQRAYLGKDIQSYSNWPAPYPQFNSYSYNCPFPMPNAISNGWRFDPSRGPDYPFAADINPGQTPESAMNSGSYAVINSPNHFFEGQNVVYCDGHTEWQQSAFAGQKRTGSQNRDNIYSSGTSEKPVLTAATLSRPVDAADAVLLPTVKDNAANAAMASRTLGAARSGGSGGAGGGSSDTVGKTNSDNTALYIGIGVAAVVILGLIGWLMMRRRAASNMIPTPPYAEQMMPTPPYAQPPQHQQQHHHRSGFSISDLCVLLAFVILLAGVAMPQLASRAREQANRIKCASNLRLISQHGFLYGNSNARAGSKFPRTYFDPSAPLDQSLRGGKSVNPTPYSFDAANPPGPVGTNNVQASFYLLFKASPDLGRDVLVCPSAAIEKQVYDGEDLKAYSNWPAPYPQFNSYSYNCPFPTAAAVSGGWKFDLTLGPDYPFASDINPGDRNGNGPTRVSPQAGREAMRPGNSPNHWFDGQQVAYCDGHVEWQPSPFGGVQAPQSPTKDNIFTAGAPLGLAGGTIWSKPTSAADSIMLPTVQDSPGGAELATRTSDMTPPMDSLEIGVIVVGGLILLGIVVLVIWLVKRKKPAMAYVYPPGGYPPGAYPPGGYPPNPGYPPQGYQGYPPQQAYPPQGYPQQPGHPPPNWPPQQQ